MIQDFNTKAAAFQLRYLIETQAPHDQIGQQTVQLVRALGGNADISQMSPGAASLYLLALIIERG